MRKRNAPQLAAVVTEAQALDLVRCFARFHGSQRKAAKAMGVTAAYLNGVLQGKHPPSPKLLACLGLKRAIVHCGPNDSYLAEQSPTEAANV